MKPFESLDVSDKYLRHNTTYYAHNHATEPDGINAGVKAIESALKAFELPSRYYALTGDGTGVMASRTGVEFAQAGKLLIARVVYNSVAGSIFKVVNGNTPGIIFDFGVTGNYECYLNTFGTIITSPLENLTDLAPMTIGVYLDTAGVQFFENGMLGDVIPHTFSGGATTSSDILTIGDGFNGDISKIIIRGWEADLWGTDPTLTKPPSSFDFPPMCEYYYDFSGGTLLEFDHMANGASSDLTLVDGIFQGRDFV